MRVGLVIYGDLETVSGGYLYDRMLVAALRASGDEVEIISLPWRNYARHLADNFSPALRDRLREGAWDVLLQDELNHPSLFLLNAWLGASRPWPVVAIVHHLRSSEMRPAWQNRFYRWVERRYLDSVDGFIFNSVTTQAAVARLVGRVPLGVVAPPGRDHRLSDGRRTLARDDQDGRRSLLRDDDDGRRTLVRGSLPGQAPASGRGGRRSLLRRSLPGQAPASGRGGRRSLLRRSLPEQAPASGRGGRRSLLRRSLPVQAPASEISAQVIQRAFAAGPLRVIFVGNLIPRKGLHTVLDALAQLPAEACRLTVVGSDRADPRYAALIRDRIARLGLAGRVELIGPLPDDALNQLLAESHVLAVPSSYEGYGIVYAEALGYGLPVIASTAGAAHEIITDGREGYLVAPEDAAAVAAILRGLSSDRAQLAAMAQAALERFAMLPTWAESTARARAFLASMIR